MARFTSWTNGGRELWSCAPDDPAGATLIGFFPSGGQGLVEPAGVTNVSGTLYILDSRFHQGAVVLRT